MKDATLIKASRVDSLPGGDLTSELYQLLWSSISARNLSGATYDIQCACLREEEADDLVLPTELPNCTCKAEEGESCDLCDEDLRKICSADEVRDQIKKPNIFSRLGKLFATIKVYDYISLVEHAYASMGDKPFSLKSNKDIDVTDEQIEEIAEELEENIENYIEANDIRVDEIPEAFNFGSMYELTRAIGSGMIGDIKKKNHMALSKTEDVIERIFNRANFMREYIEVVKDTADYPLGVMWIDDYSIKQKRIIKNGKPVLDTKIQTSVERIHPANIFFTSDYRLSRPGRAIFRVKRYSYGDIMRWATMDTAGSEKLNKNVKDFLEEYENGGTIPYTMLFRTYNPLIDVDYDVVIGRGMFTKEKVKELGVEIPAHMKIDKHIPCEAHFSGSYILKLRVLEHTDRNLGVYTTVFRRNGDSIFGFSVHDFTYPFAKLYENLIDAMDKSVGKAMGMFVQVDTSVIEEPEKYFARDDDGNIVLDISDDQLIEFKSSEAYMSPNFRGYPITVTQVPSNLDKLVPMLNIVLQQMELITKIPTLLTDASDVSSALRTDSSLNRAFKASAKIIQALLRESERRVLEPAINYIFENELLEGRLNPELSDLEPEILLSDTLSREANDDRKMIEDLTLMAQFRDLIPPKRFAALINSVAREAWNIQDDDLIPGAGLLDVSAPEPESVGP